MATPVGTVLDPATAARYRAPQTPGTARVGRSGLPLVAGKPQGWEPNVRYQNGAWWSERIPRLKNCPPVDTGTSTLVDLVLSSTQTVGPGHDPARELVRRAFGLEGRPPRMADTWESALRRLLRAPFQGAAAFEWVTYVDAEDATAQPAGTVYLDRLYDLNHRALAAYLTDEQERLVGLRVYVNDAAAGVFGTRDVPASQLLYLCFRPQGTTDLDGWGLWRAIAEEASDHAEVGNHLRNGARRFAVGDLDLVLDIELAAKLSQPVHTQGWVEAEAAAMADWASRRESAANGYAARRPWWKVGILGGAGGGVGGYNPSALVAQRDAYARTIYEQLAAEYLLIGTQGGGSYSAAEVKVSRAASVAQNLLDWAIGELDRQVVQPLVRLNFPTLSLDQYPKIQTSGLRAKVFVEKLALLIQLAQAGLVTKTDQLEDAVVEALELPPRTEDRTPEQRGFMSPVATEPTR